jgi:hypothetical protein
MKKFFTLCAALMSTAAVFAQEETTFSFLQNGTAVANGSTVVASEIEVGASIDGFGDYCTIDSHISLKNNTDQAVPVIITLEAVKNADETISFCGLGTCVTMTGGNTIEQGKDGKTTLGAQTEKDMKLEAKAWNLSSSYNSAVKLTAQVMGDPEDAAYIIVEFAPSTSGIRNVNATTSKVALHGRTLNYNFGTAGSRTLRVYNVSGAAVMSQHLTGAAGTVNLSNLPAGIYLYKVQGAQSVCGKVVVK